MRIFRLTKAKYQDTAFTGFGALRSAGRWHRAGVPVVYASDTPAGALLEVIAHTEAPSLLTHAYALFMIDFERDRHLLVLEPAVRPDDWRRLAWPRSTQRIGTRWFEDQDSVILQVPSAIVPQQHNYLINPQHPHFQELKIEGPAPFEIDPRLTSPSYAQQIRLEG